MRARRDEMIAWRGLRRCAGLLCAAVLPVALMSPAGAADLPTGFNPNGDITIEINGKLMTITSQLAAGIVNWNSFSIGADNTVHFQLDAGSAARILNRITGNDPSQIHGTLTSNGIVYIVNPAGVVFHNGSVTDVAGIYAAAGQISDSDFLNSVDRFTDVGGNIVIHPGASLQGQLIALIGERVFNSGHLATKDPGEHGLIALLAGNDVLIGEENGRLFVRIDGHEMDGQGSLAGVGGGPAPSLAGDPGVLNAGTINNAQGQVFLGAGDLFSLATRNTGSISAKEVNFAAANGAVQNQGVVSGGTATFAGDVIHLGSNISTSEAIHLFDPVTLDTSVTLTSGEIIAFSSIDGATDGNQGLTLNGNSALHGAVGLTNRLGLLDVNGPIYLGGSDILTKGLQQFFGDVAVGSDVTLVADEVRFNSLVDAVGSGSHGIVIDGRARISAPVGSTNPLAHLHVSDRTTINTNQIATTGDQSYGGEVILAQTSELVSSGGSIAIEKAVDALPFGEQGLTISASDDVRFGGNIGAVNRLEHLEINSGGVTTFEGSIIWTVGDIRFNPLGDAQIPEVATFAGLDTLTIDSSSGSFFMGHHQKLSVLGDLSINALAGSATLGDLSTLGNMAVNAPQIFLQTRLPHHVRLSDGGLASDFGLDFVAGGSIHFSSAPVLLGPGLVQFSSPTGDFQLQGAAGPFLFWTEEPVTKPMFFLGNVVLDLHAPGRLSDNLAENVADAVAELDDPLFPEPLRLILLETLGAMNLTVRGLTAEEYAHRAAGRDIYDDSANVAAAEPQVAVNRLRRSSVISVVDTYLDLFVDADIDPNTGARTNVVDRRHRVRDALDAGWREYRRYTAEPTAEGFRAFVAELPKYEALVAYVAGLERLHRELLIMGLTTREFEMAIESVLAPIAPDGLSWRELRRALSGSRL